MCLKFYKSATAGVVLCGDGDPYSLRAPDLLRGQAAVSDPLRQAEAADPASTPHRQQAADEGGGAADADQEAQKAQLGEPEVRGRASLEREGGRGVRARGGTQLAGAQRGAGPVRPRQGRAGAEAQSDQRKVRLCSRRQEEPRDQDMKSFGFNVTKEEEKYVTHQNYGL